MKHILCCLGMMTASCLTGVLSAQETAEVEAPQVVEAKKPTFYFYYFDG